MKTIERLDYKAVSELPNTIQKQDITDLQIALHNLGRHCEHKFVIYDKETYEFLCSAKYTLSSPLKLPFEEILIVYNGPDYVEADTYLNFPITYCFEEENRIVASATIWIRDYEEKQIAKGFAQTVLPCKEETTDKIARQQENFIGNFLSLINSVHIDYSPSKLTRQQRRKRERKGIVDTSTYISIDHTLRAYLREDKEISGAGVSPSGHWVRGHWRLLSSEFYTTKRGQLTWVRPHVSGSIEDIVNKPYLVKTNGGGVPIPPRAKARGILGTFL